MTGANQTTIHTADGPLTLVPASSDLLADVARYWPLGLASNQATDSPRGLIFQLGETEQWGVKLQPADVAEADAVTLHHLNRALIAAALPHYAARHHRGLLVPCAYHKQKAPDRFETGIAIFVGPDAASRPALPNHADTMYDDHLGTGATAMIFDLARALAAASQATGLPMQPVIGMELVPRSALGGLALHFLVAGERACVVKHPLDGAESVWRYLVKAEMHTVSYAPMIPVMLPA